MLLGKRQPNRTGNGPSDEDQQLDFEQLDTYSAESGLRLKPDAVKERLVARH